MSHMTHLPTVEVELGKKRMQHEQHVKWNHPVGRRGEDDPDGQTAKQIDRMSQAPRIEIGARNSGSKRHRIR
jgi:hypothetical protein